jgi:arylsulfatase A-like enzyme
MIQISTFTLSFLCLIVPLSAEDQRDAESPRPNIILILADDLGYGDPGCYGGTLVPTPHIDSLARDGVRFTNAYVTAPVCGPSRCGLMTGSYNQRFGCQWNEDEFPKSAYVIPPGHLTLPEALRADGYFTGHLGKWNLTRNATTAFDEIKDLIGFEADYFPNAIGHYQGVDEKERKNSGKIQGVTGPERPGDEYLTDRIGRHAVEFIKKQKNEKKPFFLNVGFNAPHSPFHAKKSLLEKYGHLRPEPLNFYAAMVASMDENIGLILAALKENGLQTNTLVVFTSDNGPTGPLRIGWLPNWRTDMIVGSAEPLTGKKGGFQEGGIREPYILRWPGKLEGGQIYEQPVSTMDLYPTLCAAAGASIPSATHLNGVNLLPFLSGEKAGAPHAFLFWKKDDLGAVRSGNWKLLIHGGKIQLFNLKQDIRESNDLATIHPDITAKLLKTFDGWSAGLPPRSNPMK